MTAYEMRISDWSSDVCSSDLPDGERRDITLRTVGAAAVYYTLIFLAAGIVLVLLVRLLKPRRAVDAEPEAVAAFRKTMVDRLRIDADIVRRPHKMQADASEENIENRLRNLQSLRDDGDRKSTRLNSSH